MPRHLTIALLLAFASVAVAAEPQHPQSMPKSAAAEALRLLEAGEHKALLENFIPPEMLEEIKSQGDFDKFVEMFKERKAPRLLAVLQQIKGADPEMNDAGDRATWMLDKPEGSKRSISFEKHGDLWYIGN